MIEPHDEQDIANLLSQLGEQTPGYPPDLLEKRRAAYYQSLAGLGIGLAGAGAGAAKGGLLHTGLTVETLLKGLIVAAVLVEAVGGIALYRSRLSQHNPLSPTSSPTLTLTASLSATSHLSVTPTASPTASPTATATLAPLFTSAPHPDFTRVPDHDDNGNHFGHTPTPPGHRGP
jgi:hypothetical protein